MRRQKAGLLGRGKAGHAVHIMVAVAFDMLDADQIDQCEVLLQRKACLNGQVFAGHEIARRTGLDVPLRASRGIENGFVQPLAALAGDAAVAEAAGSREGAEFVVGFVDDDRLDARQRRHVVIERMGAGDRLFDEQNARDQPLQERRILHPAPQFEQRRDIIVLFVAVKRDEVRPSQAIENGGNLGQSGQIGVEVAANLELEIAVAVGRHDFLQRFRQAIADLSGMTADRVDQPDGMARGDGARRCQLREKTRHVETGKVLAVAAQQRRIDTGEVVVHAGIERTTKRPEQRVEDGTVELRRAVIGHQRVEAVRGAGLDLLAVMRGEMAKRGSCLAVDIGAGREPQRQPQLVEIILVRQRQVLVEPFRGEQFCGGAPLRSAVGKLDTNAHEALRRLGECHDAEPERHPQPDVSFVENNLAHAEQRRSHAVIARQRPQRSIALGSPNPCSRQDASVMFRALHAGRLSRRPGKFPAAR